MARPEARLPENVAGEFFVDATCIDCDLCRQIAPETFTQSARALSYVHAQPGSAPARHRALMALVACPTASIGTQSRLDARAAAVAFPEPIADGVYFCGYASERSYGASSYLIVRDGGNVLVDSPRASRPLMTRIESLGGVRFMFLTHADDVADHRQWHDRFGCTRVMHRGDRGPDTSDVEQWMDGEAPVALADDLLVVPVPGHTAGSAALLYRERFLFTGDHLWWSPTYGRLHASRNVCWFSWPEQLRSVERLLDLKFEWVLPGHGRRHQAPSADDMRQQLAAAVAAIR